MKVLMQGKVDLFSSGGGDRIQIENTAAELKKLDVEVDIIPGFNVDYSKYDIVHLFQLDWTPETYLYANKAKEYALPLVLSPIHHNVQEVAKFDSVYTFDFRRFSKMLFSNQFHRDTLKNVYKSLFDPKKLYPTFVSVVLGLENMERRCLELSDVVLVQTNLEAQDLINTFGVDIHWKKVVNGVGEQFLNVATNSSYKKVSENSSTLINFDNYIVSVGRIEARKNQINIIHAVANLRALTKQDFKLVFIGRKSKVKHFEYIKKFDKLLKKYSWITHIDQVPYAEIPSYLSKAKVCVSASWFETTGLTSLEALFCHTNAVASGERAREYLGNHVSYCVPDDIVSISSAIEKEYVSPRPTTLPKDIAQYTWKNAAIETLKVYNDLLIK